MRDYLPLADKSNEEKHDAGDNCHSTKDNGIVENSLLPAPCKLVH